MHLPVSNYKDVCTSMFTVAIVTTASMAINWRMSNKTVGYLQNEVLFYCENEII